MKGGGKNSFTRYWQERIETPQEGEDEQGNPLPPQVHYEERSEKMKHAKKFLGWKNTLACLPSEMGPGEY